MSEIPANLRLITATIKVGANSYTEHIQDFEWLRRRSPPK